MKANYSALNLDSYLINGKIFLNIKRNWKKSSFLSGNVKDFVLLQQAFRVIATFSSQAKTA